MSELPNPDRIEWPPRPDEVNLYRSFTRKERAGLLEDGCLTVGDARDIVPKKILEYETPEMPSLLERLTWFHPEETFYASASSMLYTANHRARSGPLKPGPNLQDYLKIYVGRLCASLVLLEPYRFETLDAFTREAGVVLRTLAIFVEVPGLRSRYQRDGNEAANGFLLREHRTDESLDGVHPAAQHPGRAVSSVFLSWNPTVESDHIMSSIGFSLLRRLEHRTRNGLGARMEWVLEPLGLKRFYSEDS